MKNVGVNGINTRVVNIAFNETICLLFLNEVYDILGFPRTKAGAVVGWVYDEKNPIGDNFVDFGLFDESNNDFINGFKNTAILDFNVDGDILNYI